MHREFNVLALLKGNERYVFVYDDESRDELIASFRDQAADPHLTFTWFDAHLLTDKAREQARSAAESKDRDLNVRSSIEGEETEGDDWQSEQG